MRSIIIDGKDNVVTPIIKDRTTPSLAPFVKSASAIGIVPKISAYMGIPAIVAIITPRGLPVPRIRTIKSAGIQLWINAPIATPIKMYGVTFFTVDTTCSHAYFMRSLRCSFSLATSTEFPLRMNSSTQLSRCSFSIIVPPTTAMISPNTT